MGNQQNQQSAYAKTKARISFAVTRIVQFLYFSSLWLSSVTVQPGLCPTCSETTLLVFPRGGSILCTFHDLVSRFSLLINLRGKVFLACFPDSVLYVMIRSSPYVWS